MLTRNASWPGPNHGAIVPPRPQEPGKALLAEIEAFSRRHGMAVSTVCRRATGWTGLDEKLRDGLNPKPVTIDKVRAFITNFEERAHG